jgi:Ser/Thr protein kinase RdoA (MazF antagonist)
MDILKIPNEYYPIRLDHHGELRDGGSTSCTVFSGDSKYFLRVIKPAFFDTAITGVEIQVFLQIKGFPVPSVILTKDALPYIKTSDAVFVLYEYIEGSESNPEQDAEAIGELVGKLHHVMKDYTGQLVKRDKHFYIDRYIYLLRKKQNTKVDEFLAYGNILWEKVKDLPYGYCHGDMYVGNIHKTPDEKFYLLDFDTSCEGFPMYDPTLLCNRTHYFDYDENGYGKSKEILSRFLTGYMKHSHLSQTEINAFYDLIALFHFALQATILEVYGLESCDNPFLEKQLDWLYRWREQCENEAGI